MTCWQEECESKKYAGVPHTTAENLKIHEAERNRIQMEINEIRAMPSPTPEDNTQLI